MDNTRKRVCQYIEKKKKENWMDVWMDEWMDGWMNKAVVAGPAGRRAPDHFFGRVCFPPCPFFLVLAHFSLRLPLIFNLLMQSSRVIHRPAKV